MPLAILKVVAEIPEFGHGEMDEKPIPAPNASSTSVSAAAAIPPATTAPHATADCCVAATSVRDMSVMTRGSGVICNQTTTAAGGGSSAFSLVRKRQAGWGNAVRGTNVDAA